MRHIPLVGKKPIGPWEATASDDPQIIESWRRKGLNAGLLTGNVNGIVVRDFDGEQGVAIARAEYQDPKLREFYRCLVRTPNNGLHQYLRMPDFHVPNAVKIEKKPIDLRSTGGYVVSVGSRIRNRVYAFLSGFELRSVEELPVFPEFYLPPRKELERHIEDSGDRLRLIARAIKYAEAMDPAISGQHGHGTFYRFACKMVRQPPHGFGLSMEEALPIALLYNQRCVPPFQDRDVERKLREALKQDERG